ncbi:uncharacterized protein Tco025E_09982, partial [Trypanosoma conorhini]
MACRLLVCLAAQCKSLSSFCSIVAVERARREGLESDDLTGKSARGCLRAARPSCSAEGRTACAMAPECRVRPSGPAARFFCCCRLLPGTAAQFRAATGEGLSLASVKARRRSWRRCGESRSATLLAGQRAGWGPHWGPESAPRLPCGCAGAHRRRPASAS